MADKLGLTGLKAQFITDEFEKGAKKYERGLKDAEKATKDAADNITKSTQQMGTGLDDVGDRATAFRDKLRGSLRESVDSLRETRDRTLEAKEESSGFADVITNNIGVITRYAAVITIAYAALNKYIDVVKEAIAEFQEFANEVNRVQIQTGLSAREASLWVTAADAQGVSARSLAAGFAQVSRNLTNMQLKIAAGKEDNTNFARTLRAIGIEARNVDGSFKDMSEITAEVNEFIRELGPGWQAAGVAQNIYGRGAANLLPIILDETVTLEELNKLLDDGAALTEEDVRLSRELTLATLKVEKAKQRLKNTLAREYIPLWTELNRRLANTLNFLFLIDKHSRAVMAGFQASGGIAGLGSPEYLSAYADELIRLNGIEEEAARAEKKLTEEREAAINALFAEADATDKLAEKQEDLLAKMDELDTQLQQRQEDIALRFNRRWEDIMSKRWYDMIERTIKFMGDMQELHIRHQQKLEDIAASRTNKQKEIQDDLNDKIEDAERDAQAKREKLARDHQDRLVDIRNDYLDSVEEAARTNDAVAVLRARREQQRSVRDEGLRYARSQRELEIDLSKKRDELREDAAKRAQEEQDDYDEQIRRAEVEYRRQVEALKRKNAEDARLLKLKYQEEEQAFNTAKARAYQDAQIWYQREKEALETQIQELKDLAVQGVADAGAAVATATGNAISQIFAAAMAAMPNYFSQSQRDDMAGVFGSGSPSVGGGGGIDAWYRRTQDKGYRAAGGMDVVRRPTRYIAGEQGVPEIAAFVPLTGNMQHNFGRMNVDFNGLPAGMDTQQAEAIVYQVMMEIAQRAGA